MQPHSPHNNQLPDNDDRKVVVPARNDTSAIPSDRNAAAEMVRGQIDNLYDQPDSMYHQNNAATPISQAVNSVGDKASANNNPQTYARSHSDDAIALGMAGQSEVWEKYHSAWQNYYQQYYQRYYLQQLNSTRQKIEQQNSIANNNHGTKPDWLNEDKAKSGIYSEKVGPSNDQPVSKNQATSELKNRLLEKIIQKSKKVRGSQHFKPLVSAMAVGVLFIFLQYNQLVQGQIRAYVSPGSISPQNIIVDPNATAAIGSEPMLVIPKLNVEAPIVYGVGSLEDPPVQKALEKGVVHYPLPGANSKPGQIGNNVILGHSTHDVFNDGKYKFVFVLLERMEVGDTFYINHEGTRYTYSVTKKEVIRPSEVGKLIYPTDKPITTLVTCVPIGTAANRLLVTAEQISPDPTRAIAAPSAPQTSQQTANLPGNAPTLLERLFGR